MARPLEHGRRERRRRAYAGRAAGHLTEQRRCGILDARHAKRRAEPAVGGRPAVGVTDADLAHEEPEQFRRVRCQPRRQRHEEVPW